MEDANNFSGENVGALQIANGPSYVTAPDLGFGWFTMQILPGSRLSGVLTNGELTIQIEGKYQEPDFEQKPFTATIVVRGEVQPNITPYQPTGWSDKIVVSNAAGTHADSSSLSPNDTLYVDWAAINDGLDATAGRFFTELYVDGVISSTSWYSDPPVPTGDSFSVSDYVIDSLSVGTHTIRIKTDSTNVIAESNEGDNEYTKSFLVGPAPVISLAGTVDFGDVRVGSSAQSTFMIRNTGEGTLNVSEISYPPGFSGPFQGSVLAGGSQSVTVTFSPSAAESYGGILTVESNSSIEFFGQNTLPVSGRGLSFAPANDNFANAQVLSPGDITLPGEFEVTGSNIGATLEAGEPNEPPLFGASVWYEWTPPVSGTGYVDTFGSDFDTFLLVHTGTTLESLLRVVFNDDAENTLNSSVSFPVLAGTTYRIQVGGFRFSLNPPAQGNINLRHFVSPDSIIFLSGNLAFGDVPVGSSAQRTLLIQNTGSATLQISGIIYPPGFSGPFQGLILAGGSQAVPVTFAPATAQNYEGILTVASNATSGNNTRQVSGAGFMSAVSATQISAGYKSPGTLTVNCEIRYPSDAPLRNLLWRPELPLGGRWIQSPVTAYR